MKCDNFPENIINYVRKKLGKNNNGELRKIYVNYDGTEPEALNDQNFKKKKKNNIIKTSKYSIWNFLPKNLFEQFRRIANMYFLINIIIIFVIPDPPTSPYTSIIPLAFVVIVTAVKQAYEDFLRHKSDRQINNSITRVLKEGKFTDTKWKDIHVGDIVEVKTGKMFPCDLVLLNSQTEDDICHITTANLDGETNLKEKRCPKNLMILDTEQKLSKFKAIITCDRPNTNLYEFKGKILQNNIEYPITNDNILLRGSMLKISPVIYGCAIYTGHDTKVMLNSKFKSNKLSCIEKKLNSFIFVFLGILAILTLLCFSLSFIYIDYYKTHWYLQGREPIYYKDKEVNNAIVKENRNLYNFIVLVFYMNLLNYIVPLSMYVTIELQRFVGSQFIEWDLDLYDEETERRAKANTSDLNEDLGQVEYLFSDKTGTLTRNEMIFKQFSIKDKIYEERSGKLYQLGAQESLDIKKPEFSRFFELMSLCHTVQIDLIDKTKYQASSPDEMCFIDFCHNLGIIYEGDRKMTSSSPNKARTINFLSSKKMYEIMQILEFDSTRKRMSIIVKELNSNKYVLYVKGADSAVLPKCTTGDIKTCEAHIKSFGMSGWRTLALGYKELSEIEYSIYDKKLLDAFNDIENRNEKLAQVYEEIESKLILVGATAIEDKLQEDVAETLKSLRESGVKIWVLTGDKIETAINISSSCQHFSEAMEKFFLTSLKDVQEIKKRLEIYLQRMNNSKTKNFALIIDGETLGHIFHNSLELIFAKLCSYCEAVLGCRLSPAQKAQIVKLIKESKEKPITAAIGDGANDVSMIQEAHIGFGLFGKEGNNAAKSSDFCFAKFKFLRRILLVHGYLYYTRSATLVQYFFYKNITFVICQVYFAIWNAFSVTSLYNSIILTFYNITLTSAPILLFGLFEQNIPKDKILKDPKLYKTITKNKSLSAIQFFKWNTLGIWHSLVAYFFSFFLIMNDVSFHQDGKMSGSMQFGGLIILLIVLIVHAKLLLEWRYFTWFTLLGYLLSVLGFILFCFLPNSFIMPSALATLTDDQNLYWIFYDLLGCGSIWFLIFLSVIAAILPDVIIILIENLIVTRFLNKDNTLTVRPKSTKRIESKTSSKLGDKNALSYTNKGFESDTEAKIKPITQYKPPIDAETNTSRPQVVRIKTGKKENYYKTVVTKLDEDIIFNTLV